MNHMIMNGRENFYSVRQVQRNKGTKIVEVPMPFLQLNGYT